MHFGMTGWVYLRHTPTAYSRRATKEDYPLKDWPPKAWKFALTTDGPEPVEAAFVDTRRFARIRLIDCPDGDIRSVEPLSLNGPDPVIDKSTVTEEWLRERLAKRAAPIKAILLDQAFLSGVGNWVADEVLYHAGIHPEQRADTLPPDRVAKLHAALRMVTQTAVDLLADSTKFPDDWLMRYRWDKGKKDAVNKTADGSRITFVTVGGRTSAVVESRQKLVKKASKVGSGEVEEEDKYSEEAVEAKEEEVAKAEDKKKGNASKGSKKGGTSSASKKRKPPPEDKGPAEANSSKRRRPAKKEEVNGEVTAPEPGRSKESAMAKAPAAKKAQPKKAASSGKPTTKKANSKNAEKIEAPGQRRSGRLSAMNGIR